MRDALTLALEEYSGAVVLVSHDRSLIRAVADELWLVADGDAKLFDGDLEDYKDWIETRRPRETVQVKPEKPRQPAVPKPNRKALQSKQAKLETELGKTQTELAEINLQLGDPATYTDCSSDFITKLNIQREILETKIAELEESWLEMEVSLEGAL
jgi:ATP-binding cassette subfamily F protein 3